MNAAAPTIVPTLSHLAAARLADMIDYAAQITSYEHHEFTVVDCDAVEVPELLAGDGRSTLAYRVDLVGPENVKYRVRFHEDRAANDWDARMSVQVVVGEGDLEDERDVWGPVSHAEARTAAVNCARYYAVLAHS